MTFLEFVCEQLMGPPARVSGGRSWWLCPFHADNNPSFSTLPHDPKFKDRFRCHACAARGDEFDILRKFYDRENYGDRIARLKIMREDFEREGGESREQPAPSYSSFGDGGDRPRELSKDIAAKLMHAEDALTVFEREILKEALRIMDQFPGVPFPELARSVRDFDTWAELMDRTEAEMESQREASAARVAMAMRRFKKKGSNHA